MLRLPLARPSPRALACPTTGMAAPPHPLHARTMLSPEKPRQPRSSLKTKRQPPAAEPQPSSSSSSSARDAADERRAIGRAADAGTSFLVDMATLCFAFLLAPQLLSNAAALSAGKASSLAALSPAAAAAAFAANAALLVRFLGLQERGAATVQAIGVGANGILLSQLAQAGLVGSSVGRGGCLGVTGAVLTTAALKALGALDTAKGERLWRAFSALIGTAACAAVPACLASTAGVSGGIPPLAGAAAAVLSLAVAAAKAAGWLGPVGAARAASAPAWAATALFVLQPLAQAGAAIRAASAAAARAGGVAGGSGGAAAAVAALGGLAPATLALAALGNGLCIPRAALTRDTVWGVGTVWGCLVGGWAPLLALSILQARAAGGGLPSAPLANAVALLTGTLATIVGGGLYLVWQDGRAGAALGKRK